MLYDAVQYVVILADLAFVRWRATASQHSQQGDEGQATPEYALVILAAVALAATLIVWAKKSGAIAELFEFVIGKVKEAADK
ncbi:MAG: hypothetical protein C4318_03350 [Acidimicrobiia bacterium]